MSISFGKVVQGTIAEQVNAGKSIKKGAAASAPSAGRDLKSRLGHDYARFKRRFVPGPSRPAPGELPRPDCRNLSPPFEWDVCALPDSKKAPMYNVYFSEELYRQSYVLNYPLWLGSPDLYGAQLSSIRLRIGTLAEYTQSWLLKEVRLGDLVAVRSLAPSEEVELEIKSSIRNRIDRRSSRQQTMIESRESSTLEREIMSVMQSAASSRNWSLSVGASGGFSLGSVFGLQGNTQSTLSESMQTATQQSTNRISEASTKSSQTIKLATTIEVRGVSETIVTERNSRKFKNPYEDRSLLMKVFTLVKRYIVATGRTGAQLCFSLEVGGLSKSVDSISKFIYSNRQFLAEELIDDDLKSNLELSFAGIRSRVSDGGLDDPVVFDRAKAAMDLLYKEQLAPTDDLLLPLMEVLPVPAMNKAAQQVSNSFVEPPGYFDQGWPRFESQELGHRKVHGQSDVGLQLYFILYDFYLLWRKDRLSSDVENKIVPMAKAVATAIRSFWPQIPADAIAEILNENDDFAEDYTEVFRRIPGFLAYYTEYVEPLLGTYAQEAELVRQQTEYADRLIKHIQRFSDYYSKEYIAWTRTTVGGSLFAERVTSWIHQILFGAGIFVSVDLVASLVRPQYISVSANRITIRLPEDAAAIEAFVDAIEALGTAAADTLFDLISIIGDLDKPDWLPDCEEIELPIEGHYIEAIPGACPALDGIPVTSVSSASATAGSGAPIPPTT